MDTKIKAIFTIYHNEKTNPDAITEILGLKPKRIAKKYGTTPAQWQYYTGFRKTYVLADCYNVILENLKDKVKELLYIKKKYKAEFEIGFISKVYEDSFPENTLEQDILDFADKIKATVKFDVIYYPYEDDVG